MSLYTHLLFIMNCKPCKFIILVVTWCLLSFDIKAQPDASALVASSYCDSSTAAGVGFVQAHRYYIDRYISGNAAYKDSLTSFISLLYCIKSRSTSGYEVAYVYSQFAIIFQLPVFSQKDSALHYADKAIKLATADKTIGNQIKGNHNFLADLYYAKGMTLYSSYGNMDDAADCLLQALDLSTMHRTRCIANNTLATIFSGIQTAEAAGKALYYCERTLQEGEAAMKEGTISPVMLGFFYTNFSLLLSQKYGIDTNNRYRALSLEYLLKGHDCFSKAGMQNISTYYYGASEYYEKTKQYDKALLYIDSAISTPAQYSGQNFRGRFLLMQARLLQTNKQSIKALKILDSIDPAILENDQLRLAYHHQYYQSYIDVGNYKEALRHLEGYSALKDSLDASNTTEKIFKLNKMYDLAKKDLDIAKLEQERTDIDLKLLLLQQEQATKDLAIARLEQTHTKNGLAIAKMKQLRMQDDLAIAQLEQQRSQKSLSIVKLQRQRSNIITGSIIALLLALMTGIVYYMRYQYNKKQLAMSIKQLKQVAETEELKIQEAAARAMEEEHHRIGSELHNELGATIAAAANFLQSKKGYSEEKAEYELMAQQLKQAYLKTRNRSHELYQSSITDEHFFKELEEMLKTFFAGSGISVTTSLDIGEERLPVTSKICLLHIFRECATNIRKHSKADDVHLLLYFDRGMLHLNFTDNGIGYKTGKGIGLKTLEEEVKSLQGKFEVKKTEKGMKVYASWPV